MNYKNRNYKKSETYGLADRGLGKVIGDYK